MGASARGFLLFSFAFSSVLSSPELINDIQSKPKVTAADSPNNNTNVNVAITHGCLNGAACGHDTNIEKREISYQQKSGDSLNRVIEALRDEPNDVEKRARVGFTGMRGKKEDWSDDDVDLNRYMGVLEKRARMVGFNGMRGKKSDEYYDKRAPMGFHGMRGKKDMDENYEDDAFASGASDEEDGVWDKRSMAFHGMRGRRTDEEPMLMEKRGPFGLFGNDDGYALKRALGFLGMRGKKTPELWSWYDYGKRGIQSGFYGMKGKKAQSGFFGMRGKKSSPAFYGALVDGESLGNDVNSYSTLEQPVQSERVRRGTMWLRNSKKAKNAFFAARGKKSSAIDDGSELNLISSSE